MGCMATVLVYSKLNFFCYVEDVSQLIEATSLVLIIVRRNIPQHLYLHRQYSHLNPITIERQVLMSKIRTGHVKALESFCYNDIILFLGVRKSAYVLILI